MWLHHEEGLTDGVEAGDVHHPGWVEMLQLQAPLVEETGQKPMRGVPEPALMECMEGDDLVGIGSWNNLPRRGSPPVRHLLRQKQPLHGKVGQHGLIHIRRPQVRHRTLDLRMNL